MEAFSIGLGAAVMFALACVLGGKLAKRGAPAAEYDERQIAAQGRAARAAIYAYMIYAALGILLYGAGVRWFGLPEALFLGMAVTVGVFAVVCIWEDAYFRFTDRPGRQLIPMGLLLVVQALSIWRHVESEGWMPGGQFDPVVAMNLSCAALLVVTIGTALLRLGSERRREANDEES